LFLVRLLLYLALAAIGASALLYLFSRDRKYLKFIGLVIRFTIFLGVIVFLFFAFERIVGSSL
jgi:hypothetical protein